jgi:hypothetical protein
MFRDSCFGFGIFSWDVIAKAAIWQEKSGLMKKGECVLIGAKIV